MLQWMDWFAGAGGSSQGLHIVPGCEVILAANHWSLALASHASNFPGARHEIGDIRELPVHNWPVAEAFWASPECKQWTNARGKAADYASTQTTLPGLEDEVDEKAERSRALMWDIPKYLEGVQRRGQLVLVGVVENVIEARNGRDWDRWIRSLHKLRYRTKLVAFNSAHAQRTRSLAAPQSRDRLYLVYWHISLGRDPNFDKWLRPQAHCQVCDRTVDAIQVFKNPRRDMGRYGQSYLYRCPSTTCRNAEVIPEVLSALTAIDTTIPAPLIGDRPKTKTKPQGLAPNTINRVLAGMHAFWQPLLTAGTPGALPPFLIPLRGGGDKDRAIAATEPLRTVSAEGNHHGFVPAPHLLLPYYSNSAATTAQAPLGALSTHDRYALMAPALDLDAVPFRMLQAREVGRGMAFGTDYIVLGKPAQQVMQYGNAVTPPVAELLASCLLEAVTGEQLERDPRPNMRLAA
ncbi:DNA cytosine methyltransferase [Streptomyces xiamenensis]|uniref:DNA cytosine methyltransferase n=1 Tax=Streptomyces xiamenensis TaxID=408015 RepID=UPI0035DB399D